MKTIDLIAGARPTFMKIPPIIDALKADQTRGCRLYDFPLPRPLARLRERGVRYATLALLLISEGSAG